MKDKISGIAAQLLIDNIDTDQIIPTEFLKSIKKYGFGDYLFDGWRYLKDGDLDTPVEQRGIREDFMLNQPCLLYTSPSPRDQRGSRMPSSA